MPGYQVKYETVTVGGTDYLIRSLLDLQQYSDPLGEAELAGISPASWPLFGHIWPSARVLARAMHSFDLTGKRILEIGASLALASLVIHRRAGDMTVRRGLLFPAARYGCRPLNFTGTWMPTGYNWSSSFQPGITPPRWCGNWSAAAIDNHARG